MTLPRWLSSYNPLPSREECQTVHNTQDQENPTEKLEFRAACVPCNGQAVESGIPLKTGKVRFLICLASVSSVGYALQHTIQLTASDTSGRGG